MNNAVEAAFGKLTALVAKRKRALTQYEQNKHFRWYGDKHLAYARGLELDIRYALFITTLDERAW